jgi:hypothetical protein
MLEAVQGLIYTVVLEPMNCTSVQCVHRLFGSDFPGGDVQTLSV